MGSIPTLGTNLGMLGSPVPHLLWEQASRWFESSHPDHPEGVAQQAEHRVANADTPDHPRSPSPMASKAHEDEHLAFNQGEASSRLAGGTIFSIAGGWFGSDPVS